MWIPQDSLHKSKIAAHFLQAILTFITGCVTLAIMTDKGSHDSRVRWCFVLCFLSTPALMYQIIVPCWTRLWRLGNPYVFVAIDSLFTIFWMSAFASTFTWTTQGTRQGAIDKKPSASSGSCKVFAFGSATTCKLAKASTGLGATLFILFLLATVISGLDAYRFWKSGTVRSKPEVYGRTKSCASSSEAKGDWSMSTEDLEGAKYASDTYHGWAMDQECVFVESDTIEGRHPGRHVRIESTRTLDYENTSSAMSPTTGRYTGIFPLTTANYTFSRE